MSEAASEATHPAFLQKLRGSREAVWRVVQWLTRKGYAVNVPPYSEAPRHRDWRHHKDDGDLYLLLRVEVKQLGVNFTGRDDWPYGDQFIVCARYTFDTAKPRPFMYVILSHDLRYAAVVYGADHKRWNAAICKDSRRGLERETYYSPLDLVQWTGPLGDDPDAPGP